MAKITANFEQWVAECGWSEADLQSAYRKVKLRRNIYGLLCLTPLALILLPFWTRAAYLTKAIKKRDLDADLNKLIALIFGLSCLYIYPFIMMMIIKKTNWGMGINKV